jgi:Ca2+-binding RTX toxin-like protein
MIDVFVVLEMAGQTLAVTGTKAAERFVLSSKFGGSYSIVLKALSGADQIPSFTLDGSAELVMGDGSDRVTLEAQALTADLGKGDDELVGNGKNGCEVKGGPGEDTIRCSGETVVIDGGTGNDTITSAFAGFGFALNGGPGNDRIYAKGHVDEDKAAGGDGADLIEIDITGSNSSSSLHIFGDDGDDVLRTKGQPSAEFTIEWVGGVGRDRITCSPVTDRLLMLPCTTPAGSKRDVVFSFADGTDRIVVEDDANYNQDGYQTFQFVGQTTNPAVGQVGWYSIKGGKVVIGNNGRTVFEIKLAQFKGVLDPTDFEF